MKTVEVSKPPLRRRLVGSGALLARRVVVRGVWLARPRVPLKVAGPYVRRKVRRALDDPTTMSNARMHMEHLLGASGRASEIESASRGYVEHWTRVEELRWHPRSVTRQRVEGAEHLEAAHALGKGVLLSFVHHAHFDGVFASVARSTGIPVQVLTAATPSPGPNLMQHFRVVGMGGGLLSAAIGTAGLVDEMKQGHVVAAAIDVPGGSVTTFAGRQVKCSSGPARAAFIAGAPVVLLTSHRDADGAYIRLSEPLMPESFDNAEALLEELVRRHEGPLLEWPDGAYIPAVCWRPVDA